MSELGKPEATQQPTATPGSEAQPAEKTNANPETVEVSTEVRSYLKGLGLEQSTVTPEMLKLAEAGMKQKQSVSRISAENEQLLARIESQGRNAADVEDEINRELNTPELNTINNTVNDSAPQSTPAETTGISENEIFDLARDIQTNFPELSTEAESGAVFRELRQLGYFSTKGFNKKAIFEYLGKKNAQAKELRELREFKAQYSKPDSNPAYNPTPGVSLTDSTPMSHEAAHQLVITGNKQHPRYEEAVQFLRQEAIKKTGF